MEQRRNGDAERAADYLGGAMGPIAVSTLAYWRSRRKGPRWYRLGKRVMYDFDDLDAFIEQSKSKAAS